MQREKGLKERKKDKGRGEGEEEGKGETYLKILLILGSTLKVFSGLTSSFFCSFSIFSSFPSFLSSFLFFFAAFFFFSLSDSDESGGRPCAMRFAIFSSFFSIFFCRSTSFSFRACANITLVLDRRGGIIKRGDR